MRAGLIGEDVDRDRDGKEGDGKEEKERERERAEKVLGIERAIVEGKVRFLV